MNDIVCSTAKVLGNLQRSRENLRDSPSGSGRPRGCLIAAFWPVIEWVEDQDNVITNEALDQQFGPLGAEPVDDVLEKSLKVHVALLALTESGNFDIVLGAASSGLGALRRLVRRWDPPSGGKRRGSSATNLVLQIGANCKIYPQDLEVGGTGFADTKGAN